MDIQQAASAATRPRIHDVDALRGFALLGIFIVNITFMASGFPGNLAIDPQFDSGLDNVVRGVSSVFVDMKFYVLFSFLFGYSFTLQMGAAQRAGAAFKPRMLRRIIGLFLLGAINIVALYSGDILTTYAAICLILLALRNVSDRNAIRIALGLYAFVLVSLVVSGLFLDRGAMMPSPAEAHDNAVASTQAMLGGWDSIIGNHLAGLWLLVVQAVSMQGPTALGMFLLGMVAGRRNWLAHVSGNEPVLRRIQWAGFPIGIAGALVYMLGGADSNSFAVAASVATAPALAAAYVATLLRIMHHPRGRMVSAALAPAGRMALSNYLGQSLVGLLIFTGVGLGMAGTLSPLGTMTLAILIFVGQLVISSWWLRRFRYGPVEWLLRWMTNARRPAWLVGSSRAERQRKRKNWHEHDHQH